MLSSCARKNLTVSPTIHLICLHKVKANASKVLVLFLPSSRFAIEGLAAWNATDNIDCPHPTAAGVPCGNGSELG
jgi:hypothetical protein